MRSIIEPGEFVRPQDGPAFGTSQASHLPLTGLRAWRSCGGHAGHPTRALPYVLDVPLVAAHGRLVRVHLVGVFGLASETIDPDGTLGAEVHLIHQGRQVYRHSLIAGRHYDDARRFDTNLRLYGDGSSRETIGRTILEGSLARVDLLTIDLDLEVQIDSLRFRDRGTPTSFVLFDVFFEVEPAPVCPFRGGSGGVSLAELGAVVRVADRVRFARALRQLEDGILATADLDEARSMGLTFIAVVNAAMLEMGAPRDLHHLQLRSARHLDTLPGVTEIAVETRRIVSELVGPIFSSTANTGDVLIDKALRLVERHFGKDIQDADIADQLGLSTSHFRFLFKQATGHPFHRYLISLRLERARSLLVEQAVPVAEIARTVGFTSAAHFSRAFQKRFRSSPSSMRQSRR